MKPDRIPVTDSIQELAQFWDTHDLTDFEDELEEVTEEVEVSETTFTVNLQHEAAAAIQKIAESKGFQPSQLIQIWVVEKINSSQLDQTPSH